VDGWRGRRITWFFGEVAGVACLVDALNYCWKRVGLWIKRTKQGHCICMCMLLIFFVRLSVGSDCGANRPEDFRFSIFEEVRRAYDTISDTPSVCEVLSGRRRTDWWIIFRDFCTDSYVHCARTKLFARKKKRGLSFVAQRIWHHFHRFDIMESYYYPDVGLQSDRSVSLKPGYDQLGCCRRR